MSNGRGTVQIVTVPGDRTAVVAAETTWEAFPGLWRELLAEVWAFVRGSGLEPGRNVMLYRDDVPHVEVGVEAGGTFTPTGRVVPSRLPEGCAAVAVARGAPSADRLGEAHAAIGAWCAAHGHTPAGPRWEVYGHWREHQDPAAYETEVYWLLA